MDTDTIQALFTNRMHVLRDYGRRVVKPVAREVARRERDSSETVTPSWVSKLLIRHPATLSADSHRSLKDLMTRHKELQAIQEYRDRLMQLWNDANHARAVQQLKEWCAQAEASGIRALRDFANRLAGVCESACLSQGWIVEMECGGVGAT